MADQGGIQLLPESRRKIEIKTPGENRWVYAGAAALVLVFLIAAGLAFYRGGLEDQVAKLDANLVNLEKKRDKKVEANLLTLNKQLALTASLLNNHIFWSKALAKVEALTQPQVQFSTFNAIAEEGKFEIKAFTLNYTVLARQIAAYVSDDSIKDIDLSNVHVLTNGRLEFTIRLTFDKDKFIKDESK
ncbi:MAG: hypothetical protein HYT67_01325 [Candidatus Yanofskybacteria bacterium]|nr:hypothetical protein [Candidatus Yanofskybacteria bacterium]